MVVETVNAARPKAAPKIVPMAEPSTMVKERPGPTPASSGETPGTQALDRSAERKKGAAMGTIASRPTQGARAPATKTPDEALGTMGARPNDAAKKQLLEAFARAKALHGQEAKSAALIRLNDQVRDLAAKLPSERGSPVLRCTKNVEQWPTEGELELCLRELFRARGQGP